MLSFPKCREIQNIWGQTNVPLIKSLCKRRICAFFSFGVRRPRVCRAIVLLHRDIANGLVRSFAYPLFLCALVLCCFRWPRHGLIRVLRAISGPYGLARIVFVNPPLRCLIHVYLCVCICPMGKCYRFRIQIRAERWPIFQRS